MQQQNKIIQISVVMGSQSDWPTMKHCCQILQQFNISYEKRIVSAHRTPERLYEFAHNAHKNQLKIIIAGAGGAAHLPGMIASMTSLPVLGVPIESKLLGQDSLYSIVQMPAGVPVACFAIGKAGAINAALQAASILSLECKNTATKLREFRYQQTQNVALYPEDVTDLS